LPKLKAQLEKMKTDWTMNENTRQVFRRLAEHPEIQKNELKMNVISEQLLRMSFRLWGNHPAVPGIHPVGNRCDGDQDSEIPALVRELEALKKMKRGAYLLRSKSFSSTPNPQHLSPSNKKRPQPGAASLTNTTCYKIIAGAS
jgi:hypothetical protein